MKQKQNISTPEPLTLKKGFASTSGGNSTIKSETGFGSKKSTLELRFKETVAWGVKEGDHIYETSYSNHYYDHDSNKHIRKLMLEPRSKPDIQLANSLIPFETPKFLEARRAFASKYISNLDKSTEFSGGRKQFHDVKRKDSSTKDSSPESRYHSASRARTPSTDNISAAKLLKAMHLHYSQVQENFATEPTSHSDFHHQHISLYSQTFDEANTAGSSDFRKRMSPSKKGLKLIVNQSPESEIKDLLRHSYTSYDDQTQIEKELKASTINPSEPLRLRAPEYVERYKRNYSFRRSISPYTQREGDRSTSPHDNEFMKYEGAVSQRMSRNKSLAESHSGASQSDSKLRKESPINLDVPDISTTPRDIASTLKYCIEKYPNLKTERSTNIELEKPPISTRRNEAERPKTPTNIKTSDATAKDNKKAISIKTPTPKKAFGKLGSHVGVPKQGAFSGVNKKYIAS